MGDYCGRVATETANEIEIETERMMSENGTWRETLNENGMLGMERTKVSSFPHSRTLNLLVLAQRRSDVARRSETATANGMVAPLMGIETEIGNSFCHPDQSVCARTRTTK